MTQEITLADYRNKVYGGWIGKCAGGILGAPIEGYKTFRTMTVDGTLFENNFPNDDLDLQILWLDMARKKGPSVRANDYRDHWQAHVNFPWNEYGIATLNIRKGLDNPDTGQHNNAYWSQSMGSPIRSEIWGMLCPGSPAAAARYARMDSTLDHTGFSVDAEMFFSACAALAFFESDLRTMMGQAAQHTNGGALFAQLYRDVTTWYEQYGEDTAKHKIKSVYGDADFTSAPQNVGLTLLALLAFGDSFDTILQSINYGHDSDCIIATAAALIGLVKGYEAIPTVWKERIGEALMVSPELTGIAIPETVSQLTDTTCAVGCLFAEHLDETKISGASPTEAGKVTPARYHLTSVIDAFPDVTSGQSGCLTVSVESLGAPLAGHLRLTSPVFEPYEGTAWEADPASSTRICVPLVWKHSVLETIRQRRYSDKNFPYTLELTVDRETTSIKKGVPFYGSWTVIGPFITDDPERTPMDETYPDHGLASMPSVEYMNHDQVAHAQEFLDKATLDQLVSDRRDALPFGSQLVFPTSHEILAENCFFGRGERTLYFLATFEGDEPSQKKWLCVGADGYVRVWHNRELCYRSNELRRAWPMAHYTELSLTEQNEVLIRVDYPVDQYNITVGFKEHHEQHPHQSQWDATLIPR